MRSGCGRDRGDVMCGVMKAPISACARHPQAYRARRERPRAGCRFAGHRLCKDVTALFSQGRDIYRGRADKIVRLIGYRLASLMDLPVTVLGVASKSQTDDVHASLASPIICRPKACVLEQYRSIVR